MKVYLLILSIIFVLMSILSIPYPRLLVSKKLDAELINRPDDKKKFLVHTRINLFLLGIILVTSLFLPEELIVPICLPAMACIFISVLICNKRNLGRFMAYKF